MQAHSSNGWGPNIRRKLQILTVLLHMMVNGKDGNHHALGPEVFEPAGCVLVEFLRKDAACAVAHSLHQRYYDERFVSAS